MYIGITYERGLHPNLNRLLSKYAQTLKFILYEFKRDRVKTIQFIIRLVNHIYGRYILI